MDQRQVFNFFNNVQAFSQRGRKKLHRILRDPVGRTYSNACLYADFFRAKIEDLTRLCST